MEDSDILLVNTGTPEEVSKVLLQYTEKFSQTFVFVDLNKGDKRKRLWEAILNRLKDPCYCSCYLTCLCSIRLLSRDKTGLNELVQEDWIDTLLHLSGLFPRETSEINLPSPNFEVMAESQKCMSNLLFNSSVVQAICSKNFCVESILRRIRTYKDPEIPHPIKYYDMKILFLLTAICSELRPRLKEELHGLTYLMEAQALILKQAAGISEEEAEPTTPGHGILTLTADQHSLICEILKVVFNLTVGAEQEPDEEEEAHFLRLVPLLRQLLVCHSDTPVAKDELQSHTINLLMTIPGKCYADLMPPVTSPEQSQFEGRDMQALDALIKFLHRRLQEGNPDAVANAQNGLERLCPVLTVLAQGSLVQRPMRKHLRFHVLPPLRDVHHRPEEGSELRNSLCRLLTSPVTQVRDLAADFLFILCKESVSRMVKYTGYGNCAGLLANRGLMLGGRGNKGHYSSESEDSDTEEYKQNRAQINPIIGCFEAPRPNPMENMSEEQQEYEAMKLVKMMDKLTRGGVVQPCRIGEDGRPEPVQHVLQLQEELSRQQLGDNSDSD